MAGHGTGTQRLRAKGTGGGQTALPAAAGRRQAVLAAVLVFLAVESTAVASLGTPLLPTIETADHVSLAASQWALTIALLTGAVTTPVLGRLGDGRLRRAGHHSARWRSCWPAA